MRSAGGKSRPRCLTAPPRLPAWWLLGLGPFLRTPQRRLSSCAARHRPPERGAARTKAEELPLSPSQVRVNWCPKLGTVLANEEIIDGVSERGGFPVERARRATCH